LITAISSPVAGAADLLVVDFTSSFATSVCAKALVVAAIASKMAVAEL